MSGPLLKLPRELFDIITDNLTPADKLNLFLTSKQMQSVVEASLYSAVVFERKGAVIKFTEALISKPHLHDLVKKLWLEGDVLYGGVQPFDHATFFRKCWNLRYIQIQPCFYSRNEYCPLGAELIRSLGPIAELQSLTSLTLDFVYYCVSNRLSPVVQDNLLNAIFSIQSLSVLSVRYSLRDTMLTPLMHLIGSPRLLVARSERVRFTNLKVLTLNWDRLPLRFISEFLKRPRSLEKLDLTLSELKKPADMPLDTMLGGLEDCLQSLEIAAHPSGDNLPEMWTEHGLRGFTMLRTLSLPAQMVPAQSLPPSLIDLCIFDGQLDTPLSDYHTNPEIFNLPTPDADTRRLLNRMSQAIDSLPPLLTHIKICGGCYGCEGSVSPSEMHHVVVDTESKHLVDRGFRILWEADCFGTLDLPIRTPSGT